MLSHHASLGVMDSHPLQLQQGAGRRSPFPCGSSPRVDKLPRRFLVTVTEHPRLMKTSMTQTSRCSEGSNQHRLDSDDGVIMVGVCAVEKGNWEKLRSHSLSPELTTTSGWLLGFTPL